MAIRQVYQVLIGANQQSGLLDIPTNGAKALQLVGVTTSATNAMTNDVLNDVVTVLESNGFFARPVSGAKPDILLAPHAVLRLISSKTTAALIPVRVFVTIDVADA